MRISVIVPTYNRVEQLKNLLLSFSKLKEKMPHEIIIIDDCSDDGTQSYLKKWISKDHLFKAKYVSLDNNSGPAKARNLGINTSKGELIAFTDSDCYVHPRWIQHLSESLEMHDELVGVGGRVLPKSKDIYSQYYTFHRILEPPKSLKYLVSANCIFRKEDVVNVGGFDEDISNPGGEDVGLSFKLFKKGHNFGFEEEAIVYHDYRKSLRNFKKTFYMYGFGCRIVTEKYFGGA